MAQGLNKVMLIGNLGADPEIRRLNSGDPVVNFRLATSETWRDKQSGERREKTEWHNVVIFNEGLCKVAEQYLKKGSRVYLEGKIKTRKWQDQSGQDRYSTEIVLEAYRGELNLLGDPGGGRNHDDDEDRGSRSSGRNSSGGGDRGGGDFGQGGSRRSGSASRDLDDEIPFAPEWR